MNLAEQLEDARTRVPRAAGMAAQLLMDNPGQFALIAAGTIVGAKALLNLVRPRTMLEALAVLVVADVGSAVLIRRAVENGWLRFRVRDSTGQLVPLEFRRPEPSRACFCGNPACHYAQPVTGPASDAPGT